MQGRGYCPKSPRVPGLLEPRELSLHHLQGQGTQGQLFLLRDQLLKLCSHCRGWQGRRAPLGQPSADSAPTFWALLRGPLFLKLSCGVFSSFCKKKKKVKLVNSSKVFSFKMVSKHGQLVTTCLFRETNRGCLLISDKIMHFMI